MEETFIDRLKEEIKDLQQKSVKLDNFIDTTTFADLVEVEQFLLKEQRESMNQYLTILEARLSLYENFYKGSK